MIIIINDIRKNINNDFYISTKKKEILIITHVIF